MVVIEHNLDVVKTADWIIDLGPEGGAGGGRIVAEGSPEAVAQVAESHTGQALRKVLDGRPRLARQGRVRREAPAAPALRARPQSSSEGMTAIEVRGARQHNLKGIDLDIPRDQMTVCSGPSGSGKSSLAIDTLYAEGQRRYVESLSSYARQFLAPLQKPKVERITGLSPAICIEQKTTSKSPRSTVGTVTEIYDYLRILFARLGHPYCPKCGVPIGTQTADEIVEKVLHLPEGTKVYVMAPIERRDGETLRGALGRAAGLGLRPGAGRRPVGQPGQAPQAEPPPQAQDRGGGRPGDRPPRRPGPDWPTRSSRRSTWARGSSTSRGSATRPASRAGPSTATASTASATAAAAASTSWRRITSRSTARWAGARSARGWASSTAPTRRCSCPTAG